jgi:hypothetical protein
MLSVPKAVVDAVDDLRASANAPYPLAQPLPPGAFGVFGPGVAFGTPEYSASDARAVSPSLAPPPEAIPGWRITGSLWPGERYVARIPKKWNGRLVVAGTPSQRSEYASDLLFSDPLLARGYAYVCGNKSQGDSHVILPPESGLEVDGVAMPRFTMPNGLGISFWQHAPGNTLERWMDEFFAITERTHEAIADLHHRAPEATYAVGISNGGNQVRFALERSDLYAGGLCWNGALWTEQHNLLRVMPLAVEAIEAQAPERLEALGFPPDVAGVSDGSLYAKNYATYWVLSAWLYAMLFDPDASTAYGDARDPAPADAWNGKIAQWRIERSPKILQRIGSYAHTGAIRAKMIDLAAEYDHLLPPSTHFYPYAKMVEAAGRGSMYRAELIPNAQHVDSWSEDPNYPQMRPAHPRVLAAFDELVKWVEG